MDDATFERLVASVSRELEEAGPDTTRAEGSGGFYLVDNWRVRSAERESFIDFYSTHVVNVIKEMPGFRTARVLAAPIESSYSWHLQAFYEFESGDIREVFRREFDRIARQRNSGMDLDRVLDEMDEWVLAHEDGTLLEVRR